MGTAYDDVSEPTGHREHVTTISAVQEQLAVEVERTETGAVRVRKLTHDEVQEIPITLRTESVIVERVSINQPVSAEYGPRQEGDTLIVPVFEYVPVTEMRLMLKEEVRITKAAAEVDTVHRASVRREELVVERRDGASGEWLAEEDGFSDSTRTNAEK
jgi:uncharacterized protein (TIGR02271 family)